MNNLDAVKGKPTDGVSKLGVKLLLDYVLEYIWSLTKTVVTMWANQSQKKLWKNISLFEAVIANFNSLYLRTANLTNKKGLKDCFS